MLTSRRPTTNWSGNITFAATRLHRPRTVEELQRIVAGSSRVRALGSGHSFSTVADTTGELVTLDGLPATVEVDRDASTATVAAGMKYAEVALALDRAGLALGSMASLPHISVAGSIATGTHGSGDSQRSLAGAVVGLRSVGPDGELVELHRDTDGDRFLGSVVSLGALGIVAAVTLQVEPAYTMTQRVRVGVPLTAVAGQLDAMFSAAYSVSLFTDWGSGRGHVYLKDRTDRPGPGWDVGREADEPVHPIPGMPTDFTTEQLGVPGPWHARLPHFKAEFMPSAGDELQSEFFLPREQAPAAVAAMAEIGHLVAPVVHVSELRSIRADDLWMSPVHGRDSVGFHFTWIDRYDEVRPVLQRVEQTLLPFGARPHWAKVTTVPGAAMGAMYERSGDFAALVRQVDPGRTFGNDFVDALLGPG